VLEHLEERDRVVLLVVEQVRIHPRARTLLIEDRGEQQFGVVEVAVDDRRVAAEPFDPFEREVVRAAVQLDAVAADPVAGEELAHPPVVTAEVEQSRLPAQLGLLLF